MWLQKICNFRLYKQKHNFQIWKVIVPHKLNPNLSIIMFNSGQTFQEGFGDNGTSSVKSNQDDPGVETKAVN